MTEWQWPIVIGATSAWSLAWSLFLILCCSHFTQWARLGSWECLCLPLVLRGCTQWGATVPQSILSHLVVVGYFRFTQLPFEIQLKGKVQVALQVKRGEKRSMVIKERGTEALKGKWERKSKVNYFLSLIVFMIFIYVFLGSCFKMFVVVQLKSATRGAWSNKAGRKHRLFKSHSNCKLLVNFHIKNKNNFFFFF